MLMYAGSSEMRVQKLDVKMFKLPCLSSDATKTSGLGTSELQHRRKTGISPDRSEWHLNQGVQQCLYELRHP